ncbi:MAG: hypothetical protein ACXV5C_11490 [Halobacteriota archaeon]
MNPLVGAITIEPVFFVQATFAAGTRGTSALATMAWRPDAVEIVRIAKAQHYEDIKIQRDGAFAASLWHSYVQIPGNHASDQLSWGKRSCLLIAVTRVSFNPSRENKRCCA